MFDLGAVAAGLRVVWQVEYDESCQEVLRARANIFEYPFIYGDVRTIGHGRDHAPTYADILIGGFPCQPFSTAGKRAGADDDRNMWPEFARLIGEIRPRAVVLENVRAITAPSMGQPAYAFTVVGELAVMGYDAQWGIIRASDAGAPHQRARWWCVAYRRDVGNANGQRQQEPRAIKNATPDVGRHAAPHERSGTTVSYETHAADESVGHACSESGKGRYTETQRYERPPSTNCGRRGRAYRLRQSRLDRDADGVAYRLDEPRYPAGQGASQFADEPPRTRALSLDKHSRARHKARLKALGNGLMPQIAYLLLRGVRGHLESLDQ